MRHLYSVCTCLSDQIINAKARDGALPVNRMPIELKPSWKWDPGWWDIENDERTAEGAAKRIRESTFYTQLAQLHYYMAHSGAHYAGPIYGALLTDKYLIPVKREGSVFGKLHISAAIPWGRHFKKGEPISDFTVDSALWYLCMLSSMPGWHYSGKTVRKMENGEGVDVPTQRAQQGK